jgi:hypothetical protein
MTLRQPPSIAGQLLKRLLPAQDHDALLGDLCEDFQRDRSVFYFQVVGIWILNSVHWILLPGDLGFFVTAEFFFLVGFAVSGWAVGRSHRAYGITLVMPFAALIGVLSLSDLLRSAPALDLATLFLAVKPITLPAAILLGGYRAAPRVEAA